MPRDESIVWPPSHCPHCQYKIPGYLNIPLVTWLWLRGKCANCQSPISARYFLVELLTGLLFVGSWLRFGHESIGVAIIVSVILSAFVVATFIDFEHFIIPDEITLGGIVAGFFASLAVPAMHQVTTRAESLKSAFWGIAVGGGLIYGVLRLGKLFFGKQKFDLEPNTKIVFTETALELPNQSIPFEDIFYRKTDTVIFHAETVELPDRCFWKTEVRLTPDKLKIGGEEFIPSEINRLEAVTSQIVIPREAMGLGDVKFMAAIGAFMGWQAAIFSLMASAVLGSIVGVTSILLKKHEWSSRVPYGPYIALAAAIWLFSPAAFQLMWKDNLYVFTHLFTGTLR
jgi:leader peptidase (prepilin peptidase)/N-methyltransferase